MLGCLGLLLPCFAIYHSGRLCRCLSLQAFSSGPLLLCARTVQKKASLHWCSTSLAPLHSDDAC